MEQTLFDPPKYSTIHGKTWWSSSYQLRNFHGYLQQRESTNDPWQFIIYAFGDDDAQLQTINNEGNIYLAICQMPDEDHLLVNGKKYGRDNWCH